MFSFVILLIAPQPHMVHQLVCKCNATSHLPANTKYTATPTPMPFENNPSCVCLASMNDYYSRYPDVYVDDFDAVYHFTVFSFSYFPFETNILTLYRLLVSSVDTRGIVIYVKSQVKCWTNQHATAPQQ
jgi:hypothetical protein